MFVSMKLKFEFYKQKNWTIRIFDWRPFWILLSLNQHKCGIDFVVVAVFHIHFCDKVDN